MSEIFKKQITNLLNKFFPCDKFYTKENKIKDWLNRHDIENYELIVDANYGFTVNVIGDVNLHNRNLKFIPVKFNEIKGDFYCSNNYLTSLQFSPVKVDGSFTCSQNNLSSLKGSPHTITSGFYCWRNKLTSLEFCPEHVGKYFQCSHNKLSSLEFIPQYVGLEFKCDNTRLGTTQDILDFKLIHEIHLRDKVIKFQEKLNFDLDVKSNDKIKKVKL